MVRKAAFDVEAQAKARAPVDTGFMRNSLYVVTKASSTYSQASSDTPPPGASLLPEIPKPTDDMTAFVAVGANYGLYVEMGTSRMAAQPYLIPAADMVRPLFIEALARLDFALGALSGGIE
jgi:hypothetical protein